MKARRPRSSELAQETPQSNPHRPVRRIVSAVPQLPRIAFQIVELLLLGRVHDVDVPLRMYRAEGRDIASAAHGVFDQGCASPWSARRSQQREHVHAFYPRSLRLARRCERWSEVDVENKVLVD